ncbi:MAG: hypothetical protein V4468_12870 [Pseudomonadota bacterium]
MSTALQRRLTTLRRAAQQKNHFAVDSVAAQLFASTDCLDHQINLVGAMHEVGYLRNSLEPYWREFRADEAPWLHRCVERLLRGDHDYWAVAALLGCSAQRAVAQATELGFKVFAVRQYERYDLPPVRVASLGVSAGNIITPLLELGWDIHAQTLVDCARARAAMWQRQDIVSGSLVGEGTLSYFCRATLPHGAWRTVSLPFSIEADAVVAGQCPRPTFTQAN